MKYERTRPDLGDLPDIFLRCGDKGYIHHPLGKIEIIAAATGVEVRVYSALLDGEPVVLPAEAMGVLDEIKILAGKIPAPMPLDDFEMRNGFGTDTAMQRGGEPSAGTPKDGSGAGPGA